MRWGLAAAKCAQSLSCVHLFVTPWTVAHQAPLSMGFSRQEYWSGLPFLPPGDLPNPGMEPESSASPALAGEFFTIESPGLLWGAKAWGAGDTGSSSGDLWGNWGFKLQAEEQFLESKAWDSSAIYKEPCV